MTARYGIVSVLLLFAGLVLICSGPVRAETPAQEQHTYPFSADEYPCALDVWITPFQDREGRFKLESVHLDVAAELVANVTVENDDLEPAPWFAVIQNGFIRVALEGMVAFRQCPTMHFTPGLEGSDGIPGQGPDFWDFGRVSDVAWCDGESETFLDGMTGSIPCCATINFEFDFFGMGSPLSTVTAENRAIDGDLVITFSYDTSCAADADRNGEVGMTDLLLVLSDWGATEDSLADVNDDGHVDFVDLLLVMDGWGTICAD